MMTQRILFLLLATFLASCGSTKTITAEEQKALETAVSSQDFTINLQWAYPLDGTSAQVLNSLQPAGNIVNGNRVLISTSSPQIQVRKDSLIANLPYFGVRQISGGLPGNQGVEIDQEIREWEVIPTKKSSEQNVRVEAKQKGEAYDIAIRLYAKGNAVVVLNSSQRQSIRYTGTWE